VAVWAEELTENPTLQGQQKITSGLPVIWEESRNDLYEPSPQLTFAFSPFAVGGVPRVQDFWRIDLEGASRSSGFACVIVRI
jgi:hypothetical protein